MFFLVGVATGGVISGYLSDKFGRRTMLFISAVLQTIFGEFRTKNKKQKTKNIEENLRMQKRFNLNELMKREKDRKTTRTPQE